MHFTYLRVSSVFRTQSNICDAAFFQKHFRKKPTPHMFKWVLNTLLHLIVFVYLFPSALNCATQRYVNNIGISSFLETFQTRKLLDQGQFLLRCPKYISPNNWVIKTNSGLQKMVERQITINLYSSFLY